MKIIQIDNFNRETVADSLIADKLNNEFAECMCKALNERFSGELSPMYFKVVTDDYELFELDY